MLAGAGRADAPASADTTTTEGWRPRPRPAPLPPRLTEAEGEAATTRGPAAASCAASERGKTSARLAVEGDISDMGMYDVLVKYSQQGKEEGLLPWSLSQDA